MRVTVYVAKSIGITGEASLREALGTVELVLADPDLPKNRPVSLTVIGPAANYLERAPDQLLRKLLPDTPRASPIVVMAFRQPGETFDLMGVLGYADQAESFGRDLEVDVGDISRFLSAPLTANE